MFIDFYFFIDGLVVLDGKSAGGNNAQSLNELVVPSATSCARSGETTDRMLKNTSAVFTRAASQVGFYQLAETVSPVMGGYA